MTWAPNERGCYNLCESYGFFGNLGIELPDFCEIKSKLYNDMDIGNPNINFPLSGFNFLVVVDDNVI